MDRKTETLLQAYWQACADQDAAAMARFFAPDAVVRWPNTNEQFTQDAFIAVNCAYPGEWEGTVDKLLVTDQQAVTVVTMRSRDGRQVSRACSFFTFEDDKILRVDEYWCDDAPAPAWRQAMGLAQPIAPGADGP